MHVNGTYTGSAETPFSTGFIICNHTVATPTPQGEPLLAMVSTTHENPHLDPSTCVMNAVSQHSKDVQAIRLQVTQLRQDYSHSDSHRTPRAETSKHEYHPPAEQRGERGRDRHRRSPSFSTEHGSYSSAADHQRANRSHSGHPHHGYAPVQHDRHYSPTLASSPHCRPDPHTNSSEGYSRHHSPGGRSSSAPSSSPNRHPDPYSTGSQERFRRYSPDGHFSDPFDSRQIHRNDSRLLFPIWLNCTKV